MRLLRKIREGPETDQDGRMLVVGQEKSLPLERAAQDKRIRTKTDGGPAPTVGRLPSHK